MIIKKKLTLKTLLRTYAPALRADNKLYLNYDFQNTLELFVYDYKSYLDGIAFVLEGAPSWDYIYNRFGTPNNYDNKPLAWIPYKMDGVYDRIGFIPDIISNIACSHDLDITQKTKLIRRYHNKLIQIEEAFENANKTPSTKR